MNLTELLDEVYHITNRPDLYSRTVSAIQAATLQLHHADFWPRDIQESGVKFDTADYVQSWEYKDIFPRFRALKYIRKSDVSGYDQGSFIQTITPDQVVDAYGVNNVDVCYLAGDVIQIKSSTLLQYMLVGAYVSPDVTISGYNSWIADSHPYAVVHAAATRILSSIGKREEARDQASLAMEQKQSLTTSFLLAGGW